MYQDRKLNLSLNITIFISWLLGTYLTGKPISGSEKRGKVLTVVEKKEVERQNLVPDRFD